MQGSRSGTVICHITTGHGPFDDRIFYKECVSLARAGYEVHLLAPHDRDEIVEGVRVHALPTISHRLRRAVLLGWVALVRALGIAARVYHFHDPEFVPMGWLLRLISGKPVVFDTHEDTPGQILTKFWIPKPLRWPVSVADRLLEIFCLQGMGVIEASMIEDRYRQPHQSVRNLPIQNMLEITPRTLEEFQARPSLIYAGGVSIVRGAMDMLHLARELRDRGQDFDMLIIGSPIPPGLLDEMRRFLDCHDLTDRVAAKGKVPFPEALRLIRASTVGLCLLHPIPSHRYALPIKILEYMAYGLPVISAGLPCSRWYVESCGAGILVDPANVKETSDRTMQLLADPERMLRYSRNGQRAIRGGLNWESEAELLLGFYERMLGLRTEPGPCVPHRKRGER